MVLKSFFDWVFGPIVNNLTPTWSVMSISFVITLLITLVYKFCTDQKLLKSLKDEMKSLQQEAKKIIDPQKKLELSQQVMKKNMEMMKKTMKPLVITTIPILLLIGWLRETFKDSGDLLSIFGLKFGWLGTYIIVSIIFSIVLRKVLRVH